MTPLHFVVPGTPVPKERARKGRGGHWYTPERTREYAKLVRWKASSEVLRQTANPTWTWPHLRQFRVEILVVPPDRRVRDVDNIAKAVQDALNPSRRGDACQWLVLWHDDRQVAELVVRRAEPDKANPRVEVTITPLGGEEAPCG